MPRFVLLLHDAPDAYTGLSPEQMQQVIQKYVAWGDRLRSAGVLEGGEKLADEPGKVMRGRNGQVRITDGPYSETKEVLGGYYIVAADSYEKALTLARDCPHFEYGGTIEVREVDTMGP
ncbi:MAG TPA: YciI family protein [Vicinamibacterales bacterium]|nr:YciI family protein [Vicinamibacterales bacterium]